MQTSVNLLPPAAVAGFKQRRRRLTWIKILSVASAFTLGAVAWGQATVSYLDVRVAHEISQAERPIEIARKNEELLRQKRQLTTYCARQMELRSTFSPVPVLAVLTELKQQLAGAMTVEILHFTNEIPKTDDKEKVAGIIRLTIRTDSTTNSAKIVQALRECGLFQQVSLESSLEKIGVGEDLRFTVNCEF